MRSRRVRANRTSRLLVVVLTALGLVAAALPVAARPYGARGTRDEIRYGAAASSARYRCTDMEDSAGRKLPLCVHWVTSGPHKPVDADWVTATRTAFGKSWNTIVKNRGYRRPAPDGGSTAGHGPNRGLDVYIANLDDGTFGYCTHDRGSNPDGETPIPAYCVVDNDLAGLGVPVGERVAELRGTAAHEFFHAVQYAYDPSTPDWFSEGTAVAMENLVFPGGDTEHRYLDITALRQPEDPFDRTGATGYGSWLFWQYLDEAPYPSNWGPSVWRRVANRDGTDANIFAALGETTGARLDYMLADYGAWNYAIGDDWSYAEGDAYLAGLGGTRPPLDALHELTATRRSTDFPAAPGDYRRVLADPRTVHYVKVRAAELMTVQIEVTTPGSALLLKQSADGSVSEDPVPFFDDAIEVMKLAEGESVVLVLANGTRYETEFLYRVEAQGPLP